MKRQGPLGFLQNRDRIKSSHILLNPKEKISLNKKIKNLDLVMYPMSMTTPRGFHLIRYNHYQNTRKCTSNFCEFGVVAVFERDQEVLIWHW